MRNIKLVVAATGRIDDYHDRNTFCVLVADETRTFIRVIGVKLNEVSSLSDLALNLIIELISVSLVCHIRGTFMNIKL